MVLIKMTASASVLILLIAVFRTACLRWIPKGLLVQGWNLVLFLLLIPVPVLVSKAAPPVPVPVRIPPVAAEAAMGTAFQLRLWPLLWGLGAFATFTGFACSHWRMRKRCAASLPVADAFVLQWQRRHCGSRKMQIRQSDQISGPLVYGVWRPVILLPPSAVSLDDQEKRLLLTHEWRHICHRDVFRKWMFLAALSIHWFNPLVWLAHGLFSRDLELYCDEYVLRLNRYIPRQAYFNLLMRFACVGSAAAPMLSRHPLEERMMQIMTISSHKRRNHCLAAAAFAGILALSFSACAAVNAVEATETPVPAALLSEKAAADGAGERLIVPAQDEILQNGYPVNERGETYGPVVPVDGVPEPELQLARNRDGQQGYIRVSETDPNPPQCPEEAVKRMPRTFDVNLYLQDGETVVGLFRIG